MEEPGCEEGQREEEDEEESEEEGEDEGKDVMDIIWAEKDPEKAGLIGDWIMEGKRPGKHCRK